MLVEVLRRVVHAGPLFVADVAVLRLGEVEVRRCVGAVDVGQRLLLLGVVDEYPLPTLGIGARGSLQRQFETPRQYLARHRLLEIEPLAHRTRGGQDFIRGQVQWLFGCHSAETTFASMAVEFSQEVSERLESDHYGWLTTVAKSGQPVPRLVWFYFAGSEVTVYSMPNAAKVRHVNTQPTVSMNFASDGNGAAITL